MTTPVLSPLQCDSCGGHAPLRDAPTSDCAFCETPVPIPADYLAAARERLAGDQARAKAEPAWASLSQGPTTGQQVGAGAALFCLPLVATATLGLLPAAPWSTAQIMAAGTLPAFLPGAAWAAWIVAVVALGRLSAASLAAKPSKTEGGPLRCRGCGAALTQEPDALSCTCLYCATDSVVADSAVAQAESAATDKAQTSLGQAVDELRARRTRAAVGISAAALGLAVTSAAVWFGLFATV